MDDIFTLSAKIKVMTQMNNHIKTFFVLQFIFVMNNDLLAQTHKQGFIPGIPLENQLREHGYYTNKTGEEIHAPAHSLNGGAPEGATAKCRDGEYSFSHTSSGTCSRHGGVDRWLR